MDTLDQVKADVQKLGYCIFSNNGHHNGWVVYDREEKPLFPRQEVPFVIRGTSIEKIAVWLKEQDEQRIA
jgi:hypothetical protein